MTSVETPKPFALPPKSKSSKPFHDTIDEIEAEVSAEIDQAAKTFVALQEKNEVKEGQQEVAAAVQTNGQSESVSEEAESVSEGVRTSVAKVVVSGQNGVEQVEEDVVTTQQNTSDVGVEGGLKPNQQGAEVVDAGNSRTNTSDKSVDVTLSSQIVSPLPTGNETDSIKVVDDETQQETVADTNESTGSAPAQDPISEKDIASTTEQPADSTAPTNDASVVGTEERSPEKSSFVKRDSGTELDRQANITTPVSEEERTIDSDVTEEQDQTSEAQASPPAEIALQNEAETAVDDTQAEENDNEDEAGAERDAEQDPLLAERKQPEEPASVLQEVVESVFTPGVSPRVAAFMNLAFVGLFISLAVLGILTQSIHVAVLFVVSVALCASTNW
ncbi:hypothetical protein HK102_001393 [Quaeritorhiza haematococci]|nr:hypothetical protein HK102_001393 [Quaeritorhiza haematococci]